MVEKSFLCGKDLRHWSYPKEGQSYWYYFVRLVRAIQLVILYFFIKRVFELLLPASYVLRGCRVHYIIIKSLDW